MEDKFSKDIAAADANGKQRYGDETWNADIAALSRVAAAGGGVPRGDMERILAEADPAGTIHQLARAARALALEAKPGEPIDREIENEYIAQREKDREAHRRRRGW
jgi:hypothetical protein